MGKYNLQTSKKRTAPEEEVAAETPDEVSTALQRFSDHLSANLTRYAIGIVGLLVLAGGTSWWLASRSTKNADNTQKLFGVVEATLGSVRTHAVSEPSVAPPAEGKKAAEPTFETEEAKWAGAADALTKVKGDLTGPRAALASALQGRIEIAQKKYAEAGKSFGEFASQEDDSSLIPLTLENQGNAAWAAGDLAGAAGHYGKLAANEDLYYKVRGNMLLGDLYNPSMGTVAGKDKTKAGEYYEAALKALTPAEGQVFNPALRALRGEVVRRKAQL